MEKDTRKLPKISIVTPVLNNKTELEACILSVANQTYPNIEHIFIDGISTDDSLRIIEKSANIYSHIKWISEKDEGIYYAMNKGIDMAKGEWIYFLGADDLLYDNDVINSIFGKNDLNQVSVICGNVKLKSRGIILKNKFSLLQIFERYITHQAIFCRRILFDKLGKFNTKYKIYADQEFFMRWFNDKTIKKVYFDEIVAIYGEGGFSFKNQDEQFQNDKEGITKKHFSFLAYLFYRSHIGAFLDIAEKGLSVLKRRGIKSFLINIYKYFIYGRVYFKKGAK